MRRILIADDDEKFYRLLKQQLEKHNCTSDYIPDPVKVIERMRSTAPDLVCLDINFGDGKEKAGLEILKAIRACPEYRDFPVIMIAGRTSYHTVVQSLDEGAVVCTKPLIFSELLANVDVLLKECPPAEKVEWHEELVFSSSIMNKLVQEVYKSAKAGIDTLILGENGVGKDLVAKQYKELSARAAKPFVNINCPVFDDQLFATALYGYKKGSFTGAAEDREGNIEKARGGIVFLNEIGELSLNNQTKLLNFFEEGRTITPLGLKGEPVSVDVIILAATNRNLDEMVHKGLFRKDLYHRFRKAIKVPALREHPQDIPLLVEYFMKKYNAKYKRNVTIDRDLVAHLQTMPWTGNVRQLEICIENTLVTCFGNKVSLQDIKDALAPKNSQEQAPAQDGAEQAEILLDASFAEFKKKVSGIKNRYYATYIRHHLDRNRQNVAKTAKTIGICRKRLDQIMKELEIRK